MDYAPGHVGDDNYLITQSTIIPNANTNTRTASKSGKTNTATITKEPKRQPFSWSDDDFLEGWNSVYNDEQQKSTADELRQTRERLNNIVNRNKRAYGGSYRWATTPISANGRTQTTPARAGARRQTTTQDNDQDRTFLEGLYDVDGATTQSEREERTAQVENALRDIQRRFGKSTSGATLRPVFPSRPDTSEIQNLPYRPNGNEYSHPVKYQNTAASTSGNTTRTPTKEELQAAYAAMQNEFSGQNAWKHMEDVVDFVTNAATSQNNTQPTAQPATTNTEKPQSRDERVRNNYRARQQAEADARYENFDIETAEEKLRDNDYWTDRLLESRMQGYGFAGDERIAEERNALEEEIKRAKEAAERRQERYIREKVAQMPERKPGDMLHWSAGNQILNPDASQKELHKAYYNQDRSIYGTAIDELLTKQTPSHPGISGKDVISKIPFEKAKYPYAQRALDELIAQPHTTRELNSLARAAMHNDEIPVISGTKNITIGKSKTPVKVPNVSGKAASTFAGEVMNIAGYVWDAQEIMSAVSADLKDDGQIGKDTAKTTAKVVAGNVGGAVAGWVAVQVMSKALALAGTAVNPLLGVTLAVGGEFLTSLIAAHIAEEVTESLFE
ncbi:MAG: hypothetical protein IJ299_02220 [Oscillospiraceae bacterium]|nr:hypothetical protein [Oscillospiraceae bacterium]